jgi:hypothetical protein
MDNVDQVGILAIAMICTGMTFGIVLHDVAFTTISDRTLIERSETSWYIDPITNDSTLIWNADSTVILRK